MTYACECTINNAKRVASWIRERGGIAIWKSIDLSRPGESSLTPARTEEGEPYPKPHWMYGNEPVIETDPERVGVCVEEVYKVIPVSLRRGAQGLVLKLTDASQRKLDRALAACETKHGDARWVRGGLDDRPAMTVLYATSTISLAEWQKEQA